MNKEGIVDHIDSKGKTALHLMVERNLEDQLFKNANPHILDLDGLDCCDKAKLNGLSS